MSSSPISSSEPSKHNIIDWNQTPTYGQFLLGSYHYFANNLYALKNYSVAHDFARDTKLCLDRILIQDVLLIILFAIAWTFARFWTAKYVFKPIAAYFKLTPSDSDKMPESAWKFTFYLSTWSSMAYILLIKSSRPYLYAPTLVWQNYSIDNRLELDIYIIYLVQLSFYLHSLYATLRIDQWRKDTPALMLHHVICVLLLAISMTTKCHKSGLLAMFLHDGCDVLLEGTKLARYFKKQDGKNVYLMDIITNVGFASFTITWFITRLYWFPLKHIYITSVYVSEMNISVPFLMPLTIMLWLLLIMNVYWFSFILRLLYKVSTGQMKELEDNREYPSDQSTDYLKMNLNNNPVRDNKGANTRYFLRQRKVDYNSLLSGRSQ